MIKILFSPGCYGTYLARSLYYYTELSNSLSTSQLEFDSSGSSHDFRKNKSAQEVIWHGHPDAPSWSIDDNDLTVIILPKKQHYLDYYNNQFHKQENQQLVKFILPQLSITDINDKLNTGWNYNKPFDIDVPRWILREFFSMWITDCFADGYSAKQYNNIPNQLTIDTQDIILNFNNTIDIICQKIGLTKTSTSELINQNHKTFLMSQHYLNSQINCEKWVKSVIAKQNMPTPCQTIFDEAYIQHYFKTLGYEIKCNELNVFPNNAIEMHSLIYKNS